jgi:hypothetical protein
MNWQDSLLKSQPGSICQLRGVCPNTLTEMSSSTFMKARGFEMRAYAGVLVAAISVCCSAMSVAQDVQKAIPAAPKVNQPGNIARPPAVMPVKTPPVGAAPSPGAGQQHGQGLIIIPQVITIPVLTSPVQTAPVFVNTTIVPPMLNNAVPKQSPIPIVTAPVLAPVYIGGVQPAAKLGPQVFGLLTLTMLTLNVLGPTAGAGGAAQAALGQAGAGGQPLAGQILILPIHTDPLLALPTIAHVLLDFTPAAKPQPPNQPAPAAPEVTQPDVYLGP